MPSQVSVLRRTLILDPKFLEIDTNCALVPFSRMAPIRRGNHSDADPPSPPSMAEVMLAIEENRLRNERLLELLVLQGARRNNECNNLTGFLRSQPPTFTFAKEPLDADDWLRTLECKFAALHVSAAKQVNFATYLLTRAAGSWWESHAAMSASAISSPGLNSALPSVLLTFLSPSWT